MYLAAATYLSSRAFPSTLLSPSPSLVANETSYPILLPGIDSLNHARGQPVTWQITSTARNDRTGNANEDDTLMEAPDIAPELCIQLVLNTPSIVGQELFNNYGPKPNASLILGYGFSIADNPDDTIILKLGTQAVSSARTAASNKKVGHEIGHNARGADPLWEEARDHVAANFADGDGEDDANDESESEDGETNQITKDLQINLETADILSYMISAHLQRLPELPHVDSVPKENENVRKEVRVMWTHYVSGQREILQELLSWVEEKRERALQKAREFGIDIIEEEEDEDEVETDS